MSKPGTRARRPAGKSIQLRNVPPSLHRRLKVKAAEAGMTLQTYLMRQLEKVAEIPTPKEMRARLKKLPRVRLDVSPADIIREMRGN